MTNENPSVINAENVFVTVDRPERAEGDRSSKAVDPSEKHLRTDHLLGDSTPDGLGAVVTIAAQSVQFVLSLGSIMILARLLTPQDFGLFAMVTTVMGFLRVFKDAGLSTATVQREGITHAQVSNLFWINVALSGAISLLLAAGSPGLHGFIENRGSWASHWFYRARSY